MSCSVQHLTERIDEDRGIGIEASRKSAQMYIARLQKIKNGQTDGIAGMEYATGTIRTDVTLSHYWLDTVFLYNGLSTVVRARPGTGKTHLGAWVILRASIAHPNWDFLTNIPWYWIDDPSLGDCIFPNLYTVHSMSEMLRKSAESVLSGRIPAIIVDEMDSAVTSQAWREKKSNAWKVHTYLAAHLGARGPLLLYHFWNDIPNYLRIGGNVNRHLGIEIYNRERHVFARSTFPHDLVIDGDFIPYSRHGLGGFRIDVDMQELSTSIHETRKDAIARAVLANLDRCTEREAKLGVSSSEDKEKEKGGEYRDICDLRAEGLTYRHIQDRLKVSAATVKKALEWCEKQESMKKSKRDDGRDEENE